MSSRAVNVLTATIVVITLAVVVLLLLVERPGPSVGVAAAGALLTTFLIVIGRRGSSSDGTPLNAVDRRRNLAAIRTLGHVLAVCGVVALGIGAVLSLTATEGDDAARVLLVWVGPYALASALGMYTGYAVAKREPTPRGPGA